MSTPFVPAFLLALGLVVALPVHADSERPGATLKSLQTQYSSLAPPERRAQWQALPEAERAQLRQEMRQHLAGMSPAERRELWDRLPAEKKAASHARRAARTTPVPAELRDLRDHLRTLSPADRRAYLEQLSPAQRQALREFRENRPAPAAR